MHFAAEVMLERPHTEMFSWICGNRLPPSCRRNLHLPRLTPSGLTNPRADGLRPVAFSNQAHVSELRGSAQYLVDSSISEGLLIFLILVR